VATDDIRLSAGLTRPSFAAKQRRCDDCGEVFDNQGSHCEKCLNARYYREALNQQRAIYMAQPDLTVLVTRRTPPNRQHLVLVGHHGMGWCGELVAPSGSRNWSHVGPGERFKYNTCEKCLEVFRAVTGRKAEVTEGLSKT
jgi:hypothetical protein